VKAAINVNLQGYVQAFRDAEVEPTNQATGQTLTRKPFLDGTLLVRDVDPGVYQVKVTHPNLMLPIENRTIRIFDQIAPTLVPIHVRPDLFGSSPIVDVPDADLGPVQALAGSARDRATPLASKAAGEVIRAADWNTLAGVVVDLANAVQQLTTLVSPKGHDHPEIMARIADVQDNLRNYVEAFGRSILELRREIEAGTLRQRVLDVVTKGGASAEIRDRLLNHVDALEGTLQADTTVFTQKLSQTGSALLTDINQLATQQQDGGAAFLADPQVKALTAMAGNYLDAGTQTRPEAELKTYQRTTTTGGAKLAGVFARA
jgi:hypothetical protein